MKRQKRALTLLEIMIVIFLITLISGVIGYNMKGTLDRGRAFRTEQGIAELHDLLLLCLIDERDADQIAKDPAQHLEKNGLAKNPKELVKDGWGQTLLITATPDKSDFDIRSEKLIAYQNRNKSHKKSG